MHPTCIPARWERPRAQAGAVGLLVARALLLLAALLATSAAHAWTVEILTGTSAKLPNTLTVVQAGFPDERVTGVRYETRPWSNFSSLAGLTENYYAVRVGYTHFGVTYEVELTHDKLYYVSGNDPRGVVDYFEVSDGFNLALANAAFPLWREDGADLLVRVGGGVTLPNPSTVIRQQHLGTRSHLDPGNHYYLAGVVAQVGLQARYFVTDWLGYALESRYMVAHSRIPISSGHASATFHGVHVNFGVVIQFP